MKRWRVAVLACLMAACMALVLSGCQSQSYTPPAKTPTVSDAALGKAGTLRVGVNSASAPLAGQTATSSRLAGIDVDAAAYIADQMGLKVEIVDVGNDPTSALADGRVDIVLGVDASEADAKYWRSATYINSGVALFAAANETSIPTVDSKPAVAAQASSKSSWRVANLFGDESLIAETDLKAAFGALNTGQTRYVAADAVIGTYVAHTEGSSAKIIALLQDPSGYCVAVASNNTELQAAVTSAVDKLVNGGMMDIIEIKWLGAPQDLTAVTVVKAAAQEKPAEDEAEGEEGEEAAAEEGEAEAEAEAEEAA